MKIGAISALALAASLALTPAQANESWAATRTLAHAVGDDAVAGLAMQPGETVQIAVTLNLRNKPALDSITEDLMSGRSNRHITSDEFLQRFAPTQSQVDAMVAHLRQSGFVNIDVAPNRVVITADGTAASVKAGFNTELRHFDVKGRSAYANTGDAQVPAHLAGVVNAVLGLQTVHMHHTMYHLADAVDQAAAPQATGGTAVGHKATDFPTIYNADGLPAATNGTIAIIAQGNIAQTLTDLSTFASQSGYPNPSVSKVIVGSAGSDTSGIVEWNMDSQSSLAAAGGQVKQIIFYVAPTLNDAPLTAAYNRAVSDNIARAINVSLGECENAAKSSGSESSEDAIFQTAVAQGQVFSVSSGDSGSAECGSKAGQSYPASSPYVMAIGGTTLKTTGATTWAAETVCKGAGGGPSTTENAPSWQTAAKVFTGTKRGVPDISFDANPNSGDLVLVNGRSEQVGGTSLAAPLFTGFWTRIQAIHNNSLVFPGSALYQYGVANSAQMFHDVKKGTNGGYTAAAGWDYASGFGSLDVGKFAAFVNTHSGF
jgi:pseudomonalisin/xanthomonalisin